MKYLNLSGVIGQEESRNLSENTQWGIKSKFEEGLFSSYKYFMRYHRVEGEVVTISDQANICLVIYWFRSLILSV